MKLKKIIEAVLFSSPDPLSTTEIAKIVGVNVKEVEEALNSLISEYAERDTSIEILLLNEKYIMRVKPEYSTYIEKFIEKDLDRGTLRTLAVVALKQPIALSKLAKIRGNKCYEHVKKLREMGLIRAEKNGRSTILTTTKEFARYFGLKSNDPKEIKETLRKYMQKNAKLEEYLEKS